LTVQGTRDQTVNSSFVQDSLMNLTLTVNNRAIPKGIIVLGLIFLITTLGGAFCCAEDITLQWDPSPSKKVVGYKVHSRTKGGGYYSVEDVGNVTKHVVRGLSKDENYMFSVTAYDKTGFESIQSNAVRWGSRPADLGSSSSGGGCLIAAVGYGHPQAREVLLLKRFRDHYLEPNVLGRFVIRAYEWVSPPLVDLARRSETFRGLIRGILGSLAYALTHLRVSAAAGLTIVAGVIGFLLHRRKKKAQRQREGSPGGAS
jgi:hypothetical protein